MRYGDWIVMMIVKKRSNIHVSLFAVDVVSHLNKRETRHMLPDGFDFSRLVSHSIICHALASCKWLDKADIDCR